MQNYLFVLEVGNGYKCSCCRREYVETNILSFASQDEAITYKNNLENDKYQDTTVLQIYQLASDALIYSK